MNKNQIYGSIISSGRRNGKPMYSRLRISRKYRNKFKNIKKIIIAHNRSSFEVDLNNKTFRKYGEINNNILAKWFGNKHAKVSLVYVCKKSLWKVSKV